jgi:uncharacterized membrane protein YuzA (DUF378 family)
LGETQGLSRSSALDVYKNLHMLLEVISFLVATITGNHFGETNVASRAIYGLVGLAGIYALVRLIAVGA